MADDEEEYEYEEGEEEEEEDIQVELYSIALSDGTTLRAVPAPWTPREALTSLKELQLVLAPDAPQRFLADKLPQTLGVCVLCNRGQVPFHDKAVNAFGEALCIVVNSEGADFPVFVGEAEGVDLSTAAATLVAERDGGRELMARLEAGDSVLLESVGLLAADAAGFLEREQEALESKVADAGSLEADLAGLPSTKYPLPRELREGALQATVDELDQAVAAATEQVEKNRAQSKASNLGLPPLPMGDVTKVAEEEIGINTAVLERRLSALRAIHECLQVCKRMPGAEPQARRAIAHQVGAILSLLSQEAPAVRDVAEQLQRV